jgi:indole-3-glycerol phosphate synthase
VSSPVAGRPELLARLLREAEAETAARRARVSSAELERRAAAAAPPLDFARALRGDRLAVIAEMKARTPLLGPLSADFSPARLARLYEAGGAAALSVLCQETSFGGRPEHLAEARRASRLPAMRKDFVTDEYQVLEARALGADAVLLIVAALSESRLRELLALARELGMEALVEVHDEAEADRALAAGALVVGVNHRDLATFSVDTGLTARLRPLVPPDRVLVAESGIRGGEDARRMREAGADAVLVGEALMRSGDPGALLRELAVQ